MRRMNLGFDRFSRGNFLKLAAAAVLVAGLPAPSNAQQKGQRMFSSAQEAANALVTATRNNDQKAMLEILGPDATRIISSGDEAEDARARSTFVQKYEQMHRLVREPDGTTTLYVGAENWPTPIPLANKGHSWYFDTDAAKREILYRRVGENEMSAIRICQELVAAQKEYYTEQRGQYAQHIFSQNGQHDGLYWTAVANQSKSSIGPLVASAVSEGYGPDAGRKPTPYRGYYFHVLTSQGKDVPGGAKDYVSGGKMTGGFAFIAYPAEYRSSGVMTFVVGQDGVVYQKDLGTDTASLGKATKAYNPDSTWRKAIEEQQDSAR